MKNNTALNSPAYNPKGNGKDKTISSVQFIEAEPPKHLTGIVHRFLELKTTAPLNKDYRFHALPDACTYLIFDQLNTKVAGVSQLQASSEELNLGKVFHYINIRFLPGVWQRNRTPVTYGMIQSAYHGDLPLYQVNKDLADGDFVAKQMILSQLVEHLAEHKLVVANFAVDKIFQNLDNIHTVTDMAKIAKLSPRQLQRTLQQTIGLTPHDFLKILRLQQSLKGEPSLSYADQSHFIHAFRKATGYTPGQYNRKFDV